MFKCVCPRTEEQAQQIVQMNNKVGCQSCHLLPPDLATTTGGVPKGGKKGNARVAYKFNRVLFTKRQPPCLRSISCVTMCTAARLHGVVGKARAEVQAVLARAAHLIEGIRCVTDQLPEEHFPVAVQRVDNHVHQAIHLHSMQHAARVRHKQEELVCASACKADKCKANAQTKEEA
eukprot:1155037-Pelagomonas_calceolata.AAC.8